MNRLVALDEESIIDILQEEDRLINSALLIARCVLGCIFLFAGSGKLFSSDTLEDAILQYQILPMYLVRIAARFIPWAECILNTYCFISC